MHISMKLNSFVIVFFMFIVVACNKPASHCFDNHSQKQIPMELNKFDTIYLQAPDTLGGVALLSAMQNRKSDRQFSVENLSLKHLSEILWAANGQNRGNGKRTVPSALALYPIQTYAVLANGIYLYNVEKHLLEPVKEGDFRDLAGQQDFVKTAPLNLVFIADYKAYDGDRTVDAEKRLWLASLDAGHSTQNVYLYCASEGLKCVVRAGAKEKELLQTIGLNDKCQFIVAQTVGY